MITEIQGSIYRDHRGQISSVNDFHFEGVRRCYIIHHPDTDVVRGWNAHKREAKWFYCTKGSFTLKLVKPDDWDNPSPDLPVQTYNLSSDNSRVICVPGGYANWIKAEEADSILTVYSDKLLEEAANDSWRFPPDMWIS